MLKKRKKSRKLLSGPVVRTPWRVWIQSVVREMRSQKLCGMAKKKKKKKKKKRELKQNKNKSNMRTIGENINHKGKPKL